MRNVLIQIQDKNGEWLTLTILSSATDTEVYHRMKETSKFHPGKRVRAIEQKTGSVVDIF